ncbi:hypothetical protein [Halioxenophilus aromaticivorans]|uniref:Transmembrane protein n=1 Tax=Halioxenophilus aromaticivorans TaxID=1306992 RepID=A0AAV3U7X9_9ALTE
MTAENAIPEPRQSLWPGKLTFVLLCLTVAMPMVTAYWVYNNASAIPDGTVNKGLLIVPATQLKDLSVSDSEQLPSQWLNSRKWRMVTVINGQCDSRCMQNLYVSHQVHVRLAKDAERIRRFLLVVSDNPNIKALPEIALNDSGLQIITIRTQPWQNAFADTSLINAFNSLMLVDQEGFAMMSYSDVNTGSDVLDDLKRLLKYSYE